MNDDILFLVGHVFGHRKWPWLSRRLQPALFRFRQDPEGQGGRRPPLGHDHGHRHCRRTPSSSSSAWTTGGSLLTVAGTWRDPERYLLEEARRPGGRRRHLDPEEAERPGGQLHHLEVICYLHTDLCTVRVGTI